MGCHLFGGGRIELGLHRSNAGFHLGNVRVELGSALLHMGVHLSHGSRNLLLQLREVTLLLGHPHRVAAPCCDLLPQRFPEYE